MTHAPRLLVFSDLDGTLLDHATYAWQPAAPVLARLRDEGCGVVLASSKTAAEIAPLRAEIGFADWPAIVENGGGMLDPGEDGRGNDATYRELRATLARLPSGFHGFGDMTPEDIVEHTGLAPEAARKAQARQFSEPGLWTGDTEKLDAFTKAAEDEGLTVQRGGRFLTLSFGGTKADRMDEIIARYAPIHTVALGDAPNDTQMLSKADYGVIVKNPASPGVPTLPGEATGHVRRSTLAGPDGWAEVMSELIHELLTTKDPRQHG